MWAHSLTLPWIFECVNVTPGLHSQPTFFPCLCFGHEPKARVVTNIFDDLNVFYEWIKWQKEYHFNIFVICQRMILYYPFPFPLVGWELRVIKSQQPNIFFSKFFFPLFFSFILFFFSCIFFLYFNYFKILVCGVRLVMNCFGNKHKPFEEKLLNFKNLNCLFVNVLHHIWLCMKLL